MSQDASDSDLVAVNVTYFFLFFFFCSDRVLSEFVTVMIANRKSKDAVDKELEEGAHLFWFGQ